METFISKSEQDTIDFAKNFAKTLKTGDIVVLSGELRVWKNQIYARCLRILWTWKRNI